jgi:hypothetical protein
MYARMASFTIQSTQTSQYYHTKHVSRLCATGPAYMSTVRSGFHEHCAYPARKLPINAAIYCMRATITYVKLTESISEMFKQERKVAKATNHD